MKNILLLLLVGLAAVFTVQAQSLELDLFARNLLIEEYPKSKDDLKKTGDPNKWIFDTKVYNVAGIGRFFVGLANHIRIIDAPELKEYIQKYVKESLVNL